MQVGGALEVTAQDESWIALEGRAVGHLDVADHAGHSVLTGSPGEYCERGGIRHGDHVGFVDAREALDRRAVEADAFLERLREFVDGDRDALQRAKDVGEPEADEFDIALTAGLQDVVYGF